jgi:hypothetical protein
MKGIVIPKRFIDNYDINKDVSKISNKINEYNIIIKATDDKIYSKLLTIKKEGTTNFYLELEDGWMNHVEGYITELECCTDNLNIEISFIIRAKLIEHRACIFNQDTISIVPKDKYAKKKWDSIDPGKIGVSIKPSFQHEYMQNPVLSNKEFISLMPRGNGTNFYLARLKDTLDALNVNKIMFDKLAVDKFRDFNVAYNKAEKAGMDLSAFTELWNKTHGEPDFVDPQRVDIIRKFNKLIIGGKLKE